MNVCHSSFWHGTLRLTCQKKPRSLLGVRFYTNLHARSLLSPHLVRQSRSVAKALWLEDNCIESSAALQALTGNALPLNSQPLSSIYSRHRFDQWAGAAAWRDARCARPACRNISDHERLRMHLENIPSCCENPCGIHPAIAASSCSILKTY